MCIRKDIGELPEFVFDTNKLPKCRIDDIMQDDSEIADIERYRLTDDKIELINLWDEFVRNIKGDKLPGFPVWTEYLKPLDPLEDMTDYPKWKVNFILKNNQLYPRRGGCSRLRQICNLTQNNIRICNHERSKDL